MLRFLAACIALAVAIVVLVAIVPGETTAQQLVRATIVNQITQTTDGTAFSAGGTLTFPEAARRDDSPFSVGGSVADGDLGIPGMSTYGGRYVHLLNSDGTLPALASDPTHGAAGSTSGPQGMLAFRADLDATALEADGDALRTLGDGMGRALDGGRCPGGNILDGQLTNTDGASTSIIGAQGANIVTEIWEVDFLNTSATNVYVDIRDGTAGAVLRSIPLPAGGAVSRALTVPIRTTANTIVAVDASAAATSVIMSLAGCTTR